MELQDRSDSPEILFSLSDAIGLIIRCVEDTASGSKVDEPPGHLSDDCQLPSCYKAWQARSILDGHTKWPTDKYIQTQTKVA